MDESLQELENELKRLRPRRPSAGLLAGLETDLAEAAAAQSADPLAADPDKVTPFSSWLGWRMVSAAAAVVAFATVLVISRPGQAGRATDPTVAGTKPVENPIPANTVLARSEPVVPAATPTVAAQTAQYQPVGAASVLYDLREDGKVNLNDRTPARRLRYRYVDTYTWKNPATNASLKWSVPRDEVRVLPASLH